jgi:RNA polymerase sigma factor (sigma-70 family)
MAEASPRKVLGRAALRVQPDPRLVALIRDGEEAAFEELVRRFRGPLVAFAAGIVPKDRAEDVVQESLTSAHAALLRDSAEVAVRPWLYTIVRNRSLNDLRDEPRHEHLKEDWDGVPQPPDVFERQARLAGVVAGIKALPVAQRNALVKRELEGRGHGEIAAQMDLTPGAVRQLIFRARATLRDSVGLLVPTPVLRLLIDDAGSGGAAIGAGTAAGAGGGLALKAGVAALVSGVAIGGFALERGNKDGGPTRGTAAVKVQRDATAEIAPRHAGDSAAGGGNERQSSVVANDDPAGEPGSGHSEAGGNDSGSGSSNSGPGGGGDGGGQEGSGPGAGEPEEPGRGDSGPGGGDEPDEPHADGPDEPDELEESRELEDPVDEP